MEAEKTLWEQWHDLKECDNDCCEGCEFMDFAECPFTVGADIHALVDWAYDQGINSNAVETKIRAAAAAVISQVRELTDTADPSVVSLDPWTKGVSFAYQEVSKKLDLIDPNKMIQPSISIAEVTGKIAELCRIYADSNRVIQELDSWLSEKELKD